MLRSVLHPIETIRTAPVQFGSIAAGLGVIAIEAFDGASIPTSAPEWALYGIGAGTIILNSALAKNQFELRDRLEASIGRSGFRERVFAKTTSTYCGRQAARVACENYNVLPEYEAVCAQNADKAKDTWLPHV